VVNTDSGQFDGKQLIRVETNLRGGPTNNLHEWLELAHSKQYNVFEKTEFQNAILSTDEYNGFEPIELMETTVEYQKDTILFSKLFKMLFLQTSISFWIFILM